jgi:hypothetical protein
MRAARLPNESCRRADVSRSKWHKQFNAKTNVWEVIVRRSGIEQSRAYFHTEQAANSWIDRCQSRADGPAGVILESYNRAE